MDARIEQLAPELSKIIDPSQPIQHLAEGFGGALGPAEGPLWWRESRYLLFSDIHNNKRMKYVPGQSVTVFQEPTNRANGLTRDLQGDEPGVPDGMKVDVEGNVYCGGPGGIWIMDRRGKKLGRVVHGAPATTNIAFGGDDWTTLYFTSRNHLGSVTVKIPGIPVPTPKKP